MALELRELENAIGKEIVQLYEDWEHSCLKLSDGTFVVVQRVNVTDAMREKWNARIEERQR